MFFSHMSGWFYCALCNNQAGFLRGLLRGVNTLGQDRIMNKSWGMKLLYLWVDSSITHPLPSALVREKVFFPCETKPVTLPCPS